MIHRKIAVVDGKPVIPLEEADLIALGVQIGDDVEVGAPGSDPVERGKAFVERYIQSFEALAK